MLDESREGIPRHPPHMKQLSWRTRISELILMEDPHLYMGLYGIIWDYMGLYGIIWDYMGLYGLYGILWDYMGLYGILWDYMGL